MSVNIKDSSRPNDLNPVSGRVPDNVYKYEDALSLEEISASTDLTNKIPTAEAVGQINTNLTFNGGDYSNFQFRVGVTDNGKLGYHDIKDGADTVVPFLGIIDDGAWQSTSSGFAITNAEIGAYYVVFNNCDPSITSPLVRSGYDVIINYENYYGGRRCIVDIVRASATTMNVAEHYTYYYKLT